MYELKFLIQCHKGQKYKTLVGFVMKWLFMQQVA